VRECAGARGGGARAGGYNAEQSVRYVAKIKSKIAQGLQLTATLNQ
jgi:hypothetical protein